VSGVDNEQLKLLADPFPAGDIEWRVQSSWPDGGEIGCLVIPFLTTLAIETRLDQVCGPGNWCSTEMKIHEVRPGLMAYQVGISILVDKQWVTKFDVSDSPGKFEIVKSGYTGAFKRAAYKWGIGRKLKYVGALKAKTSKKCLDGYYWAELSEKHGGKEFFWCPPQLPAWVLPLNADAETPVTKAEVDALKAKWRKKFAPTETNRISLWESFTQFVFNVVGKFPSDNPAFWTQNMISQVHDRIANTKDANGPSGDVPFD